MMGVTMTTVSQCSRSKRVRKEGMVMQTQKKEREEEKEGEGEDEKEPAESR